MPNPVVYVVDDDRACRESFEALLTALGLSVQAFPNADAFLAQLTPDSVGCLITDMCMPETCGTELVGRLREIAPGLPVIIASGVVDVSSTARAAELGAVSVLAKPFSVGQLRESLDLAFGVLKDQRGESSR